MASNNEDALSSVGKFFPRGPFCPAHTGVGKLFLWLTVFILAAFDLRDVSVSQRVKGACTRQRVREA